MTAPAIQLPAARERPILFTGPMVRAILAGHKTQTRRPVKNLRVRLRHAVSSDLAFIVRPQTIYPPGTYAAGMNPQGAVHVTAPGRRDLGVKPDEFDFVCPYADGFTYLRKHPDGGQQWNLQTRGDRLWVRETFSRERRHVYPCPQAWYRADLLAWETRGACDGSCRGGADCLHGLRWTPGIHMPRALSRLTLEVTGVRLERLYAISEADAAAEGMELVREGCDASLRDTFIRRWDGMYAGGDFAALENPWLWVVEFRRVD